MQVLVDDVPAVGDRSTPIVFEGGIRVVIALLRSGPAGGSPRRWPVPAGGRTGQEDLQVRGAA